MISADNLIERMVEIEKKWASLQSVPEDLSSISKDLSKSSITSFISKMRMLLERAQDSNQLIDPFLYHQIINNIVQADAYLDQHIPNNPMGQIPPFLNVLYFLNFSLDIAIADPLTDANTDRGFTRKLNSRLSDSLAKSEVANRHLESAIELIEKNKVASIDIQHVVQVSQEATGVR